jgi:hypothetical protein
MDGGCLSGTYHHHIYDEFCSLSLCHSLSACLSLPLCVCERDTCVCYNVHVVTRCVCVWLHARHRPDYGSLYAKPFPKPPAYTGNYQVGALYVIFVTVESSSILSVSTVHDNLTRKSTVVYNNSSFQTLRACVYTQSQCTIMRVACCLHTRRVGLSGVMGMAFRPASAPWAAQIWLANGPMPQP